MRKLYIVLALCIISLGFMANTAVFAMENQNTQDPAAMGKVIEDLMFGSIYSALENYYQGQRGVSSLKTLSVTQLPNSYVYEIIFQLETFTGAHDPPYGKDTATFWVYLTNVWLKEYKHTEISTLSYQ